MTRLPPALLVLVMALGACREEVPAGIQFGFGSDMRNPVYVTDARVDTLILPNAQPVLIRGGVDSYPRSYGGNWVEVSEFPEEFVLTLDWTEIASGRAYHSEVPLRREDLAVSRGFEFAILDMLMLPGGEIVIGSDPSPKDGTQITRDIAKACGKRVPERDRDFSREANMIGGMKETLETLKDPLIKAPCGGEKG